MNLYKSLNQAFEKNINLIYWDWPLIIVKQQLEGMNIKIIR